MTPPPGPYSGASTLALVARASAFSFGLVYGSVKLKILKLIYFDRLLFTTYSLLDQVSFHIHESAFSPELSQPSKKQLA
ncbi:hypothetical protein D5086_004220 [Populus alba]|uniref:Uncharacterized protein n=1 Tax=Populus alba TaxID=43335 RepID=A0ACC4CPT0_POPAL